MPLCLTVARPQACKGHARFADEGTVALRTESDLLRTLEGTFTVAELARLVVEGGLSIRDGGMDRIQDGKERYKHRVRGALQTLKRQGRAERVGDGTWVIEGTRAHPERALLVLLTGERSEVELVLGDAAETLRRAEEPLDLIIADPPWGLERQKKGNASRDRGERIYARDHDQVVGGYQDVPADSYAEFTAGWIGAAAAALRPRGGYLAVITGPQQAARVQVAAEDVGGLTFVNQVVVRRPFALRTTRMFSHAHTVISIMCAGPLESAHRFFDCPNDLPRAQSGVSYPLSWWLAPASDGAGDSWGDVPKYEQRGLLRYDNQLSPVLVSRVIAALTPGDWQAVVGDPFVGGGTSAVVCHQMQRRFFGGDVNPQALRYTMGRLLDVTGLALGGARQLALGA